MTQKNPAQDLHRDTRAVREAVERSQYGENSEALYLTSGYVQPSAAAAAARAAPPAARSSSTASSSSET